MLRRLSANQPEFQAVDFLPGMNLIIAERAPEATQRDSRNGRGKTSLIEAVSYCLGGSLPRSFRPLANDGWAFTLTLDLFGSRVNATRSLDGGQRITVRPGDDGGLPPIIAAHIAGQEDLEDALFDLADDTITLKDWQYLLGLALFGLDEEQSERGLSPRTLLSYVTRTTRPKDPTKIFDAQPAWASRQHMAFLLGLDWHYTQDLQRMRLEAQAFEAVQMATDERLAPELLRDESQLALERAIAERDWERLNAQLQSYTVLDDPDGTLAETDALATRLNDLSDEQVADQRLLTLYTESLAEPIEPARAGLLPELYQELGLAFSEAALRRFDQVANFHQAVANNASRFLGAEVTRLQQAITERATLIASLNNRRSALLRQLRSGGGLADLLELQHQEAEAKAHLAALDQSIQAARSVQRSRGDLKVRQATRQQAARTALDTDRSFLDAFAIRFDAMIRRMYGGAGTVSVDVDQLGYKFSVQVERSSSTGIGNMQLFCFDLALLADSRPRRHPRFLIHDSVVYEGVDPRQRASALLLAEETTRTGGGQYIVTLNSNDVPEEITSAPWYQRACRRVVLDTEPGGIFGRSF